MVTCTNMRSPCLVIHVHVGICMHFELQDVCSVTWRFLLLHMQCTHNRPKHVHVCMYICVSTLNYNVTSVHVASYRYT